MDWNRLCKIGRRHHGVHIREINLLLGQWFSGNYVKRSFLARALTVFAQRSGTPGHEPEYLKSQKVRNEIVHVLQIQVVL